jgi:hypothetical protein
MGPSRLRIRRADGQGRGAVLHGDGVRPMPDAASPVARPRSALAAGDDCAAARARPAARPPGARGAVPRAAAFVSEEAHRSHGVADLGRPRVADAPFTPPLRNPLAGAPPAGPAARVL